MGIYTYSAETKAKIDKLCNDNAVQIMLDFPHENIDQIDSFLKSVAHFIKSSFAGLGTREYIFALDLSSGKSGATLDEGIVREETKVGNNLFTLNLELEVLNVGKIDIISNISTASFSRMNNCVLILVHNGIDITIYSNGVPIDQRNLNFPSAKPVSNKKFNRPAEDYRVSLIDFYREKVRTNLTNHWFDPTKRILNGGKTEDIFQNALVEWFVDNLSAKKINFKVKKISTDETDIEIVKHGGETFLLELKWLGKNQKTTYPLSKLTDAFDQVENYLEIDSDTLEATLVVYDGRDIGDYNKLTCVEEESGNWKEVKECETKRLSARATAYVFHLISQTASKRKIA